MCVVGVVLYLHDLAVRRSCTRSSIHRPCTFDLNQTVTVVAPFATLPRTGSAAGSSVPRTGVLATDGGSQLPQRSWQGWMQLHVRPASPNTVADATTFAANDHDRNYGLYPAAWCGKWCCLSRVWIVLLCRFVTRGACLVCAFPVFAHLTAFVCCLHVHDSGAVRCCRLG